MKEHPAGALEAIEVSQHKARRLALKELRAECRELRAAIRHGDELLAYLCAREAARCASVYLALLERTNDRVRRERYWGER